MPGEFELRQGRKLAPYAVGDTCWPRFAVS